MSQNAESQQPDSQIVRWPLFLLIGLALAALFPIGRVLLFGWGTFIADRFPRARLHGEAIASGVVFVVLFAVAVETLGRLCCRGKEPGQGPSRRWRSRWTASVVVGVVVLFAVGYCTIGLARHVGWVLSSDEPRFADRVSSFGDGTTNLKIAAMAAANYVDYHHTLPPGGQFSTDGEGLHSWETHILPYLPYGSGDIDRQQPWDCEKNAPYFRCVVPEFLNPGFRTQELYDGQGFGLSHFAANGRVLGPNCALAPADLPAGASQTIILGEVNHGFRPWGDPVNWRDPAAGINRPGGFGGAPRASGASMVMADGSVRFFSNDTDPAVLDSLAGPQP